MNIYSTVGHFLGRLTRKYYFEDYVRVYPEGLAFYPFGLRRQATRNTLNNFRNHVKFYNFAAQFVPGKTVADIGCGSGYGSAILRRSGAARVCGADISRQAIRFAKSRYGDLANFTVQGVTDLRQYRDKSFDVAVANEVLEHIKEYEMEERAIIEMKRISRRGGLIVIGTPNAEMMPDHGFEFAEIRRLFERNLPEFCLFENALVPSGVARSGWEQRRAKGEVGIIVSESVNLAETVWLNDVEPEIKRGIDPGLVPLPPYHIDTSLLHNTHSWVIVAMNSD